jgi:hypothetical protein
MYDWSSVLQTSSGCQWGQPDEWEVFVETPVECSELGVVLLLDELVYRMAERSEDEHCCYPAPVK